MYCNAGESKDSDKSVVKRACVPIGGLCGSPKDCCGYDDPNSGYCILCQSRGIFIPYGRNRCMCDATETIPYDRVTKIITGDRCNGHDASKTRCKVKVYPPGHRFARGKKRF
ncbi:unnamed protein product [Adineta steineri]|uniref:Uncharacterized protein n=2 Tax=Adineta steineri TaxID=433720 RepID=A0A814QPI9_9BILA|nr:unnamed protein product [Adineta steineri]